MPPKKRKQKKAVVPEAAFGAGQAGKTPYKQTKKGKGLEGFSGLTRKGIERSTVRHLTNLERPPPKRSTSTQARGDAEMMKWIKKLEKDADITKGARRRRHI